ncbi:MAG: hypothetical protein V4591_00870 [Bdellovibrionota bacterium]
MQTQYARLTLPPGLPFQQKSGVVVDATQPGPLSDKKDSSLSYLKIKRSENSPINARRETSSSPGANDEDLNSGAEGLSEDEADDTNTKEAARQRSVSFRTELSLSGNRGGASSIFSILNSSVLNCDTMVTDVADDNSIPPPSPTSASPSEKIKENPESPAVAATNTLLPLSVLNQVEKDLVKAKADQLLKLFSEMKNTNSEIAKTSKTDFLKQLEELNNPQKSYSPYSTLREDVTWYLMELSKPENFKAEEVSKLTLQDVQVLGIYIQSRKEFYDLNFESEKCPKEKNNYKFDMSDRHRSDLRVRFEDVLDKFVTLCDGFEPKLEPKVMQRTFELIFDEDLSSTDEVKNLLCAIGTSDNHRFVLLNVLEENLYLKDPESPLTKKADKKVQAIYSLVEAIDVSTKTRVSGTYSEAVILNFLKKPLQEETIERFYTVNKETGVVARKDRQEMEAVFIKTMKKHKALAQAAKGVSLDNNALFGTDDGFAWVQLYNLCTNMGPSFRIASHEAGNIDAKTAQDLGFQGIASNAFLILAGAVFAGGRDGLGRGLTTLLLSKMKSENQHLQICIQNMDQDTLDRLFYSENKSGPRAEKARELVRKGVDKIGVKCLSSFSNKYFGYYWDKKEDDGGNDVLRKVKKYLYKTGGMTQETATALGTAVDPGRDNMVNGFIAHIHAKSEMEKLLKKSDIFELRKIDGVSKTELQIFLDDLKQKFTTKLGKEDGKKQFEQTLHFLVFKDKETGRRWTLLQHLTHKLTQAHEQNLKENMPYTFDGIEAAAYAEAAGYKTVAPYDETTLAQQLEKLHSLWYDNLPDKISTDDPKNTAYKNDPVVKLLELEHALLEAKTYEGAAKVVNDTLKLFSACKVTCAQIAHILDFSISANKNLDALEKQYFYECLEQEHNRGYWGDGNMAPAFLKRNLRPSETILGMLFYQGLALKRDVAFFEQAMSGHGADPFSHATGGFAPDNLGGSAAGWFGVSLMANLIPYFSTGKTTASKSCGDIFSGNRKRWEQEVQRELARNPDKYKEHRITKLKAMTNFIYEGKGLAVWKGEEKLTLNTEFKFGDKATTIEQLLKDFMGGKSAEERRAFLENHHCHERPLIVQLMNKLDKDDVSKLLKDYYYNHAQTERDLRNYYSKTYYDKEVSSMEESEKKEFESHYNEIYPKIPEEEKFKKFLSLEKKKVKTQEDAMFVCIRARAYLEHLDGNNKISATSMDKCKKEIEKLVASLAGILHKRSMNKVLRDKILVRGLAAAQWGTVSALFTTAVVGKVLFGVAVGVGTGLTGGGLLAVVALALFVSCAVRLCIYYHSEKLSHSKSTFENEFVMNQFQQGGFYDKKHLSFWNQDYWKTNENIDPKKVRTELQVFNGDFGLPSIVKEFRSFFGMEKEYALPKIYTKKTVKEFVNKAIDSEKMDQIYLDLLNSCPSGEAQQKMFLRIMRDILGGAEANAEKQKEIVLSGVMRILNIALQSKLENDYKLKIILGLLSEIESAKPAPVFEGLQLQTHFCEIKNSWRSFFFGGTAGAANIAAALTSALVPDLAVSSGLNVGIALATIALQNAGDAGATYANSAYTDEVKRRGESFEALIIFLRRLALQFAEDSGLKNDFRFKRELAAVSEAQYKMDNPLGPLLRIRNWAVPAMAVTPIMAVGPAM